MNGEGGVITWCVAGSVSAIQYPSSILRVVERRVAEDEKVNVLVADMHNRHGA